MSKTCVRIERTSPRPGGEEEAVRTAKGYQLRSTSLSGPGANKEENAVYADTLDEAERLINLGHYIRMGRKGKTPNYISKPGLRFIYDDGSSFP